MSSDDLVKETTMRDVVARCEEGFAAQIALHQKQMDKMAMNVESMQDMLNVMGSVHGKQVDALAMRDAQIDKLKQELSAAKAMRPSKIPNTTNKLTVEDLTPAISLAVEKVTHAISSGLRVEDEEYDMVNSVHDSVLQQAIRGVFEGVIHSRMNKNQEGNVDTSALIQAVKQGVIQNTPTPCVQLTDIAPEFMSIHEAVSFIVLDDHHYRTMASTCLIEPVVEEEEEGEDLPALFHFKQELIFNDLEEEESLHDNDPSDVKTDINEEEEEDEDENPTFSITQNQVCIYNDTEVEVEQLEVQSLQHPIIKQKVPLMDLEYEPYNASIEQPFPFSFLFNQWTLLFIITYFLLQI